MPKYKVETPTVGAFIVLVEPFEATIEGESGVNMYRATTRVNGVQFQLVDNSEGHAYVAILELINVYFSAIN